MRCAECSLPVADAGDAVSPYGLHRHRQTNPHGYEYEIACYARAQNVKTASNPSREWSWFPGTQWLVLECAGCGRHLGWLFRDTRTKEELYGLIVTRLAPEAAAPTRTDEAPKAPARRSG